MKQLILVLTTLVITGCSTSTINKIVCTGNGTCGAPEYYAAQNERYEQIKSEHAETWKKTMAEHDAIMEEIKRDRIAREEKRKQLDAQCADLPKKDRTLTPKDQTAMETAVKNKLKDPWSAQFRDVIKASLYDECRGTLYFGEVNAKNSYGGYTGFKKFWIVRDGTVIILD